MLLGELLIQKKLLTQEQLDSALEEQKLSRDFLGSILVRRRFIREQDLLKVLSEQFHMPCIDLGTQPIDWKLAMRFTPSLVVDHQCLPIRQDENGIVVAITNPLDAQAISMAQEQAKGVPIRPALAAAAQLQDALKIYKENVSARIKKLFSE